MHIPKTLLSTLSLYTIHTTATPSNPPAVTTPPKSNATITNNCPFPIYLTVVSSSATSPPPEITLGRNSTYTEPYRHDAPTGGISLKLTTVAHGLYTGAPQTIFAYTYVESTNQVWFDLSDVFGDPFRGFRVRLRPVASGGGGGAEIVWEDGVPPRSGGSQVRVVAGDVGVGLGVCV
ncbi:Bys1 family protein [Aspergillus saccharolyticus JOP 1030-1]|uniref:Bys1 family protein n=1 Tax=Aspergillus saccharolyticus JOP 1030-1 TaxID=1450539 RepID=A0A318ZC73_9EURO|nr:hypothetical protein BP01DRAFT_340923 [Aspergillus saccharolyticus JOP 1030-1]PYH45016.1 hypothetical protein BP01DRAFT_340923 [Aspergillus saccharolyticus JOP 1030-1]